MRRQELAEVERPTPWSADGSQAEMDPGESAEIIRDTVASLPLAIERALGGRVRVVAIGVTGMGRRASLSMATAGRSPHPRLARPARRR